MEMTNREALERIKTAPAFMGKNGGVYANYTSSSEIYLKDIKVIEQALDRLEELEEEYDLLKEVFGNE